MKDICNFLFEIGMLKRTPRTGLQFLGSGKESVAEHCFRVIIIGYTLAKLNTHESRTGDLNYVNKKYLKVDEEKAVNELAATLPFGEELKALLKEFHEKKTAESLIANDADQLELIIMLKEYGDLGNKYTKDWIGFALKRLFTTQARELAQTILSTDSAEWWFKDKSDWWIWGK
jgi:putative hydrolase of HD superfamily